MTHTKPQLLQELFIGSPVFEFVWAGILRISMKFLRIRDREAEAGIGKGKMDTTKDCKTALLFSLDPVKRKSSNGIHYWTFRVACTI